MSSFLSQDDIDALLGAAAMSGDASSAGASSSAINPGEVVDNIVKNYKEHVVAVAKPNLSRDVSVDIDLIETGQQSAIKGKISGEYLIVEVAFSGGAEGSINFLAPKSGFAVMADLMVGGDGKAPYTDDCKEASTELFSQISGAFATELGGKIGSSVSAAAPAVLDNAGIEVFDGSFAAFCTIKIADMEPIIAIISPDETLLESLSSHFGGKAPEPESSFSTSVAPAPVIRQSQPTFGGGFGGGNENSFSSKVPKINVDMLLDIELEIAIELGKTNLAIKKVLDLAPGALVELDRLAGEPVDLLVNNKVVAKGEVVVIDENFGVRIISLVSPEERIKSLR